MTATDIRDPTGDTGTGAGATVKETRRNSTTGTAQDLVADVMEVETGTTVEAAVRGEAMVQTPTPPPRRQPENSGGRHTGREGGRSE